MGRDGRHDRSAFAHGPPHHLNHASSPPFPPPPCPLPLRPSVRHRIDREVARPAGRSVDAAPLASPASVGRNVYHASAAAHALRASRRQPVGALVHPVASMRLDVLEPHRRAIFVGEFAYLYYSVITVCGCLLGSGRSCTYNYARRQGGTPEPP